MSPEALFYQDCIHAELNRRLQKNRAYSLRAFAKALRLEAGALSQYLSGKRVPSYKAAQKILRGLELTPEQEKRFLGSLARHHQSRGLKRMSPAFKPSVEPELPSRELTAELFQAVSEWYHYAILLLTEVEGFRPDPRWIAKQLGISLLEAKLGMERLRQLELLQDMGGKLRFVDQNITTANKAITTPALRRRQRQILEKAIDSLENDPIETRSMTGMTMAIDPAKLPEAKKLISEFNRQMSRFLETDHRKEVYELQIALFPLQKKSPERT